jgi:AcrR family transcriptional regulator
MGAMSTAAAPTGAWAHHRADVRTRIVNAYLDLLDVESTAGVSMPAVAQRAGVSVRTLYRYFPTKDQLQRDAAMWFHDLARRQLPGEHLDRASMGEFRRVLWSEMASRLAAVRLQHTTPVGRAMRAGRLASSRAVVDAGVPREVGGDRRAQVVDLIVAISSSSMLLELVDRMGYDPARAADLITELVELIINEEVLPQLPNPPPQALARRPAGHASASEPDGDGARAPGAGAQPPGCEGAS